LSQKTRQLKIIDYEGSSYRTDFWEGQGREFEDLTERKALRRLLPKSGKTLIEVGAGFGRLADLYQHFEQVILLDYSISLLSEAQNRFGKDPRFRFVTASVYNLPFVDDLADAVVMIRVAHHLESIELAFSEIFRILQGGKTFILEFANKRNVKSIARYLLRRQDWSPFTQEPYEFVPLNFDFHPEWMQQAIQQAGFYIEEELAISNFRLQAIKKRISPSVLAQIDNAIAGPGASLKLSPSILTKNISTKQPASGEGLFQCPRCGSTDLLSTPDAIICSQCHERWLIIDGIFDFRYPRPESS